MAADAYLRGRRVKDDEYLTILRARLYTDSPGLFANVVHHALGWDHDDAEDLWAMINLSALA